MSDREKYIALLRDWREFAEFLEGRGQQDTHEYRIARWNVGRYERKLEGK